MPRTSRTKATSSRKRFASPSPPPEERSGKRPRPSPSDYPLPDDLSLVILNQVDNSDLPSAARLCKPLRRVAQDLLFIRTTLTFVVREGNRQKTFFSDGMVLHKEDEGKYAGLKGGLARAVARTLTLQVRKAVATQSFTRAEPASEVILKVLRECAVLEELHLPDEKHGTLLRLVPALPCLPSLTSLSFCPGTMDSQRFASFTSSIAQHLAHLTLVVHDPWLPPFDLSPFHSLTNLSLRCTRSNWGATAVSKYVSSLQLSTRCSALERIELFMPGSSWRRRADLRDRPADVFPLPVLMQRTLSLRVSVTMEGWKLEAFKEATEGVEKIQYVWTETSPK